jgi:competence protein ComEA
MEHIKPVLRWVAVAIAACAIVLAYVAPHRTDQVAAPDDSPPAEIPAVASATPDAPISSATPGLLAVYVCGAIRNPAVYHLVPGSRVGDAVTKAGGLSRDADPEAINLAEPLVDGMKIDVPKKGAAPLYGAVDPGAGDVGAVDLHGRPTRSSSHRSSHHSTGRSGSHKLQAGQTLDINTASESELTQLPGVGPTLARRIVDYRQANGPFSTIDDLQNVSGVGASTFAKMEAFLRV